MKEYNNKYYIGDVVYLKSNPNVLMTIISYKSTEQKAIPYGSNNPFGMNIVEHTQYQYAVLWFGLDNKPIRDEIPENALSLYIPITKVVMEKKDEQS